MQDTYNPEWLENLRVAVVQQACYDYLWFLRHPEKRIKIQYDPKRKRTSYETLTSLRRWFRSKDFTKTFCSVSGSKIMAQLEENNANGFRLFSEERIEQMSA